MGSRGRKRIKKRSEYGKMIDAMYYKERSISYAHYQKLCRKPKCWM